MFHCTCLLPGLGERKTNRRRLCRTGTAMNPFSSHTLLPALCVISALITPAILILATGSLIASTLTRLRVSSIGRVFSPTASKNTGQEAPPMRPKNSPKSCETYRRRAVFVGRALSSYYAATGFFIVTSLTIALDNFVRNTVPWLAVALSVAGVVLLLLGTIALVVETNLSVGMLAKELDNLGTGKR